MFSSQKEFIDAYVTNFSTGVYSRQINTCVNKFRTAKKITTKDDYTYILFTTYLQLFENFQIFLLVLFHNQWIDNIFIPNQELAKRFNEIFKQWDDNSTFENKCLFKLALEKMIGWFCWKHFSEYNNLYTKHCETTITISIY